MLPDVCIKRMEKSRTNTGSIDVDQRVDRLGSLRQGRDTKIPTCIENFFEIEISLGLGQDECQ